MQNQLSIQVDYGDDKRLVGVICKTSGFGSHVTSKFPYFEAGQG